MAQYLDEKGLRTLVSKTKEFANKRVKDALVTSASPGASKTITDWNDDTSAAVYGDIAIEQTQVNGLVNALGLKAPLNSPAFTGTPTVPYPADTTPASSAVANVKYVQDAISEIASGAFVIDTWTGDDGHPATSPSAAKKKSIYLTKKTGSSAVDPYKEWIVVDNAWECIGETSIDLSGYKKTQTAYSASSGTLATLTSITQNANGEIAVTFQDIQSATTSQAGVVQLAGSISATVENENNKAATEKAVRDAINALAVTAIDVGASNTLTSISEAGGKISATAVAIQIAKSQVTDLETDLTNIATSAANLNTKINEVSGAVATSAAALDEKINEVSGAVDGLDAEVTSTDGKNVQVKVTEVDGKITAVNITKDDTVTSADIDTAINALDFGPYVIPASGTIASISETDGKISVTSGAILISSAQISDINDVLGNYKTKQTAVVDPGASGTGITFIDSISQDANGVITPHKKTVQSATAEQAGLMSASGFSKLEGIAASATKVNMGEGANSGTLYINGTSAMGPISDTLIEGLFT